MSAAGRRIEWMLVVILLASAALRIQDLGRMVDGVHYDEAYYAVDALSLIEQPRFTPFFPENFGRESLWMYTLVPSLLVFGGSALPLRLTALFTGLLTVAAVYRLGRELLGRSAALWAAAALGALFWHVLASHQAFRAHMYPLVGTLAFAALWRAWRRRGLRAWVMAGVLFGLLAYTYIAARAWLAGGMLISGGMLLLARRSASARSTRAGVVTGGLIAIAIALPLIGYFARMPQAAGLRAEQVAINSPDQLADNLAQWARALAAGGSSDVAYNLPGRPILDTPLLLLAIAGLSAWVIHARRYGAAAAFTGLLIAASLAPALLTTDTLKPLRAVGVVIPLALVIGAGASALQTGMARLGAGSRWGRAVPVWLPLLLFAWAGLNTARDFATWVRSPDLFLPMEQHVYRGVDVLAQMTPPGLPIYFTPFTPDHPIIRMRAHALASYRVSAFRPEDCLRFTAASDAYVFALTLFDAGFAGRLRPWAEVSQVYQETEGRYAVYRARLKDDLFTTPSVSFAERLQVTLPAPLPSQVRRGDTLSFAVGLRALTALDRGYTLFAHIYGDPTPYEGGPLWAQADVSICPSSPPQTWRVDEWIVQSVALGVPLDLPPGSYNLAVGIYDSATQERLPVSTPNTGLSYAVMQVISVVE